MYVLEAANGPVDGKRWQFEVSIEIGRDAALVQAALPLDGAVSRRHARVEAARGRLLLYDLQSSNGTVVRGDAIAAPSDLQIGELFVVGRTMLRVLDGAS
ncbi:MAG: FHA domain-containing protein [Candidatus Eremiobacteraeota bacterium]|nr:FHA domain-containing protein [Candidatus Eremiobacteraeota bacterium]